MRIIETKVYQFDELDDKAKERARKWYCEYEYFITDEQIEEDIVAKGYEFLSNGKRV
jgi:hypothetical protein